MLPPLDVELWRLVVDGPPPGFVIDGELYEIAAPWARLLGVLPLVDWHMPFVYALVHPGDVDRMLDRLDDDDDDLELADVRPAVETLVEQATGRRWWVAQRLYATLAADWGEIDGRLSLAGVDVAARLSEPSRVCSLVYAYLTAGTDEPARMAFDAKLSRPPAGLDVRARPMLTPEQEGDAFMAAMGATRGGRIGTRTPAADG